jgi:hypothetical protein
MTASSTSVCRPASLTPPAVVSSSLLLGLVLTGVGISLPTTSG